MEEPTRTGGNVGAAIRRGITTASQRGVGNNRGLRLCLSARAGSSIRRMQLRSGFNRSRSTDGRGTMDSQ